MRNSDASSHRKKRSPAPGTAQNNRSADALYMALQAAIDSVQAGVRGLAPAQTRAFAELLVNRLIFVKFVEQKGWLDADAHYLYNHFCNRRSGRYWQDFLVPLFFMGLNTPLAQRAPDIRTRLGDIPYLNAELFAPAAAWDNPQVDIDEAVFELLFDTLLNPHQFTASAASPPDALLDQDHLGYGYERFIIDQHGRGAYYTNPAEVHLMCRESLRSYLELRCPTVAPAAIAELIYGQPQIASHAPVCAPEAALVLYAALHAVTACDPAAGSGVFLVAMLRHIFNCMRALAQVLADHKPFHDLLNRQALIDPHNGFDLQVHIIECSIYGCDIDYAAVQIARLRLWLELIAACERPTPLPNLAFRVVVGEALASVIGVDTQHNPVLLEDRLGLPNRPTQPHACAADLRQLIELKQAYFSARDAETCQSLRARLVAVRAQIIHDLGGTQLIAEHTNRHVLWQIDCAEMYQRDQPGFDIIIGNPPYLRHELIDATYAACDLHVRKQHMQALYRKLFGYRVKGTADLYVFFYLRGLTLVRRDGGTLCYICSNAWLDVDYGESIQRAIVETTAAGCIYDSRTQRSFAGAAVNTAITLLQTKDAPQSPQRYLTFALLHTSFDQITHWRDLHALRSATPQRAHGSDLGRVYAVAYTDLQPDGTVSGNWGGRYLRSPDIYLHIMAAYGDRLVPLHAIADVRFGLKTGANRFFHLNQATITAWGVEREYLRPIIRTPRECRSIFVDPGDLSCYLLVCNQAQRDLANTQVLEYIRWGESMRFDQRPSCRGRARWYAIGPQPAADFIVLRFRDRRNWTPLIASNDFAIGDTVFVGTFYNRQLVGVGGALLNSTLSVLMSEVYGRVNLGDGLLTTYGPEILKFPVVDPRLALEREAELTRCLHTLARRETRSILEEVYLPDRRALDSIVFDLLGLTGAEREAVYQAVTDLVQTRMRKARSIKKTAPTTT